MEDIAGVLEPVISAGQAKRRSQLETDRLFSVSDQVRVTILKK